MEKLISVFLSTLFIVFITTPTIISAWDTKVDYSYIYSTSEEEQNGEERNLGDKFPKLISKFYSFDINDSVFLRKAITDFQLTDFKSVYFELHSPPPELI